MFGVRTNILIARSLDLTIPKSHNHAEPLMPNAFSYPESMLPVLTRTEFTCSSGFGLIKYVCVHVSVVSTG